MLGTAALTALLPTRPSTLTTAIVCFGLAESRIWFGGQFHYTYHGSIIVNTAPFQRHPYLYPVAYAISPLCSLQPPIILYLVNFSWLVEAHIQHHCSSCEMYPTSVKFSLVCPLGPQGSLYISAHNTSVTMSCQLI